MITIDGVYPWGRSFDEYVEMFSLTSADLGRRIVGCADGPASFNCELTRRGGRVVSCDPLYQFLAEQIADRIGATKESMATLARDNAHRFAWGKIRSPEHLVEIRSRAMEQFLGDFERGKKEGRYVDQSLPSLRAGDGEFELALCSHFLFLYSEEFSADFHLAAILEMLRVAGEARIFPLLDMRGNKSQHFEIVTARLREHGLKADVKPVAYEFQRGGHEMLRVTR